MTRSDEFTTTLVDSNIILDIVTDDPNWAEWSGNALAERRDLGNLAINPIIYAEISTGFDSIEELNGVLEDFTREPLPFEAGFLAGKAFLAYRKRKGERRSPLPDFYIGAHSAVRGYPLLTRDAARYRTYFPSLELISPDASAREAIARQKRARDGESDLAKRVEQGRLALDSDLDSDPWQD